MSLWTLFDKTTSTIIKEHQSSPGTANGELPIGLDDHLAWLVESTAAEPTFDPNTERLEPSEVLTIDPTDTRTGTRIRTLSVVPLSAEQLADKAVQAVLVQESAAVQAIAEKFLADENVTIDELGQVVKYVALQNRLDR